MQTKQKMTQAKQIENHLLAGKTITALDALNLYGCFRLAARIAEIKKHYLVESKPYKTPGGAVISEYWMPHCRFNF